MGSQMDGDHLMLYVLNEDGTRMLEADLKSGNARAIAKELNIKMQAGGHQAAYIAKKPTENVAGPCPLNCASKTVVEQKFCKNSGVGALFPGGMLPLIG